MRVLSRVSGSYEDVLKQAVKKKTEAAVEKVLRTLKKDEPGDFNQALIETGAIVCVPNGAPLCEFPCPFYTVCEARTDLGDSGKNTKKEEENRGKDRIISGIRGQNSH